jgi:hypothetical protein
MLLTRALELSDWPTSGLVEAASYAPLPPLGEYGGRSRQRSWGSRRSA